VQMICYNYDRETFAYLGASSADADPEEHGIYLLPAYATFVPPPEYDAAIAEIVWNASQNIWEERIKEPAETNVWDNLRHERNMLLMMSDWLFIVRDSPLLSDPILDKEWREYRQALRDLPANVMDPYNISWPQPPKKNIGM
jgi:hypothetical protein